MNRRSSLKTITGFVAGVVAAFAPKAESKMTLKEWHKTTPMESVIQGERDLLEKCSDCPDEDGSEFCEDPTCPDKGERNFVYGWIHCWMDDWRGKIICHSCSTKGCSVRDYATKITNHPEHSLNDKLVAHCGWTFLYGRWKK